MSSSYSLLAISGPLEKGEAMNCLKRVVTHLFANKAQPFNIQYQGIHPLPRRMKWMNTYVDRGTTFSIDFFSPTTSLPSIKLLLQNNTELIRSSIIRKEM